MSFGELMSFDTYKIFNMKIINSINPMILYKQLLQNMFLALTLRFIMLHQLLTILDDFHEFLLVPIPFDFSPFPVINLHPALL